MLSVIWQGTIRLIIENLQKQTQLERVFGMICRLWEISEKRVTTLFLHPNFIFRCTRLYAEQKKILDYLMNTGPKIHKNAKTICATDQSNDCEKMAVCNATGSKSMILIDKLMEMERQGLIDHSRLIDQIHTFAVAVIIYLRTYSINDF